MLKFALYFSMLCLVGCIAAKKDPAAVLKTDLNNAENYVRFSMFDDFAVLQSEEAQKRAVDIETLENVKVTEVSKLNMLLSEDKHNATVWYQIVFYPADAATTIAMKYVQQWHYDTEKQKWIIDSDLPDFRAAIEQKAEKKRKAKSAPKIKVLELPQY